MAHVARFVSAAYPNTGAQVPTVPGVELGHVLPTRHLALRISAQSAAQLTERRAEGSIRVSATASNCATGRDAPRACKATSRVAAHNGHKIYRRNAHVQKYTDDNRNLTNA